MPYRFTAIAAVFIAALTFLCPPAAADITRGCQGELWMADRLPSTPGAKRELLASMEGRGTCGGKSQANKCRKRAADVIIRCARELWDIRNSGAIPEICGDQRGQPAGEVTKFVLEGIFVNQPNTVLHRARVFACCRFNTQAAEVPAQIFVSVIGDVGCRSNPKGFDSGASSSHDVDTAAVFKCAEHRANGICK